MFGTSLAVGNDILDIGSQKFDRQSDQRAVGTGAMVTPRIDLGEPGQFEVPNVADVRREWGVFLEVTHPHFIGHLE